ncbi:MAG: zinc ribbon domain-containing protein [Propionicimonas sp.]
MPGFRIIARLVLAALLLTGIICPQSATRANAVDTVTFPDSGFAGVQLTFSVTGVELGPFHDLDPNDPLYALYGAERDYPSAKWTGGPITVSGFATGTEDSTAGFLGVSLGGSSAPTLAFDVPRGVWRQEFMLTLPHPERENYLTLGLIISPVRDGLVHEVAVTATISNSAAPSAAPTSAPGLPPCPEAVSAYSLDPAQNLPMTLGYADVQKQFDDAITRYETVSQSGAFAQDNILGTLPALGWLGNQGGATSVINRQFVFTSDADRAKWTKRMPPAGEVTQGTERALYEDIWNVARSGTRKVTPGEVLYLALRQRKGDVKEALLLAHNTLRSLARSEETMGNVDVEWTMVEFNPDFLTQYLTPLVDPAPLGVGQNTGSWYHLFGTAYFEMQARGTWGAYTLVSMTDDKLNDQITQLSQQLASMLATDPNLELPANQTLYSRLTNEIESVARKRIFGSPDDPSKYCYNVMGASIGSWLYQSRVTIKPAIQPPPPPPAGTKVPTIFGDLPKTVDKDDPDTWISSSPLDITWDDGTNVMTLDQDSASLYGYAPFFVLPQYEEATDTWGMVWTSAGTYTLRMRATQDGTTHLTRIVGSTAYVYPLQVTADETLTLHVDQGHYSAAVERAGGGLIAPVVIGTPEPDAGFGLEPILVVAGLAMGALVLAVVLATVVIIVVRRRRRADQQGPSAVAPAFVPRRPAAPTAGPGAGPTTALTGEAPVSQSAWPMPGTAELLRPQAVLWPAPTCPRCARAGLPGERACARCGLHLWPPAPGTVWHCPACQAVVAPQTANCPRCGIRYG